MKAINNLVLWGRLLFFFFRSEKVQSTTLTYQAEDAELHLSNVRADHGGYSGVGYADFNDFGAYVEWTVDAPISADYHAHFRYSAKVSRPCTLVVDGNLNSIYPLHFHETGEWNIWNVESTTLYLSQGTHTLKALAVTSTGPNMDWLSLSASAPDTLLSNELLYRTQFLLSTSGLYQFGLTSEGSLVLRTNGMDPVWTAEDTGMDSCKMQGDGNLVCRDPNGDIIWDSNTALNDGAHLLVSDSGRATITLNGVDHWSAGTTSQTSAPQQTPSPIAPTHSPLTPTYAPVTEAPATPTPTKAPTLAPNAPTNSPATLPPIASATPIPASSSSVVVLELNDFLPKGQFVESPSGSFKLGLTPDGEFVIATSSGATLWSAGIVATYGPGVADQLYMQDDGNLVVRDVNKISLWDTDTYENPGAHLLLTNEGIAAVELEEVELWSVGNPAQQITPGTVVPSTPSPVTVAPMAMPTPNPATAAPIPTTPSPVYTIPVHASAVVLEQNDSLELGQYVDSPDGAYKVGLRSDGELVLETSSGSVLWSAGIVERHGPGKGNRCFLQPDGNVIVRDSELNALWNSNTSGNPGSYLVVNDGGQTAIMHGGTPIWLQGIPRGIYEARPSSQDLQFPIRGQFYYPWYPHTWTVNDAIARFAPQLGFYSSGDPMIVEEHIEMLEYAYTDLSIASWWGPDTNLDKARITLLMDKTIEMNSKIKWTIYHEDEFHYDASVSEIRSDLDYLKAWFAWHPAWAHIQGRPIVFVYNEVGCEVAERWMAASSSEWYVVLKLFKGFRECPVQPDSWHQYGPADAVVRIENHSFGVSPGFWRADIAEPRLERVNRTEFCANVDMMVQSNDPWQLITTFNEAGEGTMVESSPHWPSNSGYGFYLDCLHTYH